MAYEAEKLERACLEDLQQAAPPEVRERLGLQALTIGSAFVSIAAGLPASAIVINRAIGLGLDGGESRETVRRIVDAYADAGVARYFIQKHPQAQPSDLHDWMIDAGLEKARGWQKFSRGVAPIDPPETSLTVRQIGPEHGEAFARIACDAFDLGDAAVPWLAAVPGRPNWHVFMSFDGDQPAGTGLLFVQDGLAWSDFDTTAPAFRQRGGQSTLLAHRIRYASNLGCRAIYTCTGEDVPGDPQHSYSNILRAGFREDYVRENYAPPKVAT